MSVDQSAWTGAREARLRGKGSGRRVAVFRSKYRLTPNGLRLAWIAYCPSCEWWVMFVWPHILNNANSHRHRDCR